MEPVTEIFGEWWTPKRWERFRSKVAYADIGCWEWTAARSNTGYGAFWDGTRTVSAHRITYQLWNGPIPDGLEIDHLCRNRECVRPDHLEAVTHAINCQRGVKKQELVRACPLGHPYDKDNTYVYGLGHRQCRTCIRLRSRNEYPLTLPDGTITTGQEIKARARAEFYNEDGSLKDFLAS